MLYSRKFIKPRCNSGRQSTFRGNGAMLSSDVKYFAMLPAHQADLATERERQLTTARTNQTTGLTNGRAANWEPEVEFSPFRALSRR